MVVYAAVSSPQYNMVLKNLKVLTERLQRAKEVKTLLQEFKMEKWIADGATATANELVLLALDRIKNQVTDYDVFIRMLRSMPGVKSLADQMTGMYMCTVWLTCTWNLNACVSMILVLTSRALDDLSRVLEHLYLTVPSTCMLVCGHPVGLPLADVK